MKRDANHPSPIEEVETALAAIAAHGQRTNAFIEVYADQARAEARTARDGRLRGMTISIKDLIDVAGHPTTAASRIRAGHVAERDATVVRRLREAGAILIGKTNLHEFALGTTSEESAIGPVRNPHDVGRSAGGSSGGSAAAVAAGMGRASIGTDTGGSIRIPAAACGVVGLKPSLGEVPTDGVVPLSRTFDHVGPLARNVAEAAAIWSVIAAKPMPKLDARPPSSITLGLLGGYFTELLDRDVRTAFEAGVERLHAAGVKLVPRTIDGTETIVKTYVDISLHEAAAWHAETLATRAAEYQPGVRERLEQGRAIPEARYRAALDHRQLLFEAVESALEGCDALALPALAIVAPPLGAATVTMDNGEAVPTRSAMLRLTQLFNITGHPAISLPLPTVGLPVGLQLVGRRDRTDALLAVATVCSALSAMSVRG